MELARLPPIDKDYRNFLVKFRVGSAVLENIYFAKFEGVPRAQFAELCFDRLAQAAAGLGVENDLNHQLLEGF